MDLKTHILQHAILGIEEGWGESTGGSGVEVQDDGIIIAPAAGILNFVGENISVSSTTSGIVDIEVTPTIPSGLRIENNFLWVRDDSREKWLSSDRLNVIGTRSRVKNAYLHLATGVALFKTGYKMIRDGVITGVTVEASNQKDWRLKVRRNDDLTDLVSVDVSGNVIRDDLNVDILRGDKIQIFCETDDEIVRNVIALIEIAWKLT
jgi:hypothetical protein